MNETEYEEALCSMKNKWKASKDYYYESMYNDEILHFRKYKNHEQEEYREYFQKMNDAKSTQEKQVIAARFWLHKNQPNSATFSHYFDLLRSYGCPHSFFESPSHMIVDLYFGLLETKPQKKTFPIYHDLYHGHICKDCALNILIRTNALQSFENHIKKYGKTYQRLLEQRPLSMCNELMNLWQITLFFIQTLNYPSLMKLFMNTEHLFQRAVTLLHWFIDRWISIGSINLKQEDMTLETDPDYMGCSIYDMTKFHEQYLLQSLYALISHSVFYWKYPQMQWYLQMKMGCNKQPKQLFAQYVLDEVRKKSCESEYGFAGNMYLIFGNCILHLINKHERKSGLCLKRYLNSDHIEVYRICYYYFRKHISSALQRMNQCHFRNYLLVRCQNRKCAKKYWNHVYGKGWNDLRLERNKLSQLHRKLRIHKWYKCSRCLLAVYCSRKCQKYDWNKFHHKKLCLKLHMRC